jgi:hypothetical protein
LFGYRSIEKYPLLPPVPVVQPSKIFQASYYGNIFGLSLVKRASPSHGVIKKPLFGRNIIIIEV